MSQVRPDNGALPGDVRCLTANGVGIDDEPIPIGASAPPRLAGSLPVLSLCHLRKFSSEGSLPGIRV